MNASLIEILDKFLVVIWPMLRLSAFLAFTSIFSARAVNMRIRMSLGFAMAFFVSQQIEIPKIDPVTADGLMEISRQILIGLTMGLVFQVASAALVVGIFQAATSINEQTLSFIPKILAIGLTMSLAGGWMINTMVDYTKSIFTRIPSLFM